MRSTFASFRGFFFSNESSVFVTLSVFELVRSTKASDQPGGSMGLDKVESFQDGKSVNSMTAVLATGQISFCHTLRQLINPVSRQTDYIR